MLKICYTYMSVLMHEIPGRFLGHGQNLSHGTMTPSPLNLDWRLISVPKVNTTWDTYDALITHGQNYATIERERVIVSTVLGPSVGTGTGLDNLAEA